MVARIHGSVGVTLHPDKTCVVNTWQESFDFLGYRVARDGGPVKLNISLRSRRRIHAHLRQPTRLLFLDVDEVVDRLNRYIRGARAYFRLAPWWSLRHLDSVTAMRMARWWGKKLSLGHPAWSRVSGQKLHIEHKLLRWAPKPPWDRQLACARE